MDEIDIPREQSATDSGEEWERIALQQLREMPDARVLRLYMAGRIFRPLMGSDGVAILRTFDQVLARR